MINNKVAMAGKHAESNPAGQWLKIVSDGLCVSPLRTGSQYSGTSFERAQKHYPVLRAHRPKVAATGGVEPDNCRGYFKAYKHNTVSEESFPNVFMLKTTDKAGYYIDLHDAMQNTMKKCT